MNARHFVRLAIAMFLSVGLVACDSSSPTAPDRPGDALSVDFSCLKQNSGLSLRCTDSTTGGTRPFYYRWTPEFKTPIEGQDKSVVAINYQDECAGRTEGLLVTVGLEVIDSDDDKDGATDVLEVCVE